jgi:D-alanine-D-alanine ligase
MVRSQHVSILYDAVEDEERAKEIAQNGRAPALVHELVSEVLLGLGHEVRSVACDAPLSLARYLEGDTSDLIFNLCESLQGVGQREQHVAALLELFNKRFTGAGLLGLSLAGDKALAKKLLAFHGINTPRFSLIHAGEVDHADALTFPMFVKPSNADASIGIDSGSVVHDFKELMERISYIHREIKAPALIEEFIEGRELYVSLLQTDKLEALPIIEWDFASVPEGVPKIASAEAKWDANSENFRHAKEGPAVGLPEHLEIALKEAALEAFRSLKLRDYGRVDMRLRQRTKEAGPACDHGKAQSDAARTAREEGWEFFIIEVNPNPHLAVDSEFPMAAKAAGYNYPRAIECIAESAFARLIERELRA